jgi:farnesyl-diphosphate farnesyltransferase
MAARSGAAETAELIGPVLKSVSRSFYLSLAVLPAAVRPAVGIAYLLARATDTIADTRIVAREERLGHLDALRRSLRDGVAGRAERIAAAMSPGQASASERRLVERVPEVLAIYRGLPAPDRDRVAALLETIVEGQMEDLRRFPGDDADGLTALATRADLERYTYLVAGCVGEFWTEIHVAHRPRLAGWDLAAMRSLGVAFGQALQLTNILRDVASDLRLGRCYLPAEDLARLGLAPRDLLDPAAATAARPLRADLLRLALARYDAGWRYTLAIPPAEVRMRLACAWPLLIGLGTLGRLAASDAWLDPTARIKVPRTEVQATLATSLVTVWSNRTLAGHARRLRARVRVEAPGRAAPRAAGVA